MIIGLGAHFWVCLLRLVFCSLLSVSSLDFRKMWWLCVACLPGFLSLCSHWECLVVLEAEYISRKCRGGDLCDPLGMGLERKGQGDYSRLSVTNLPRKIGDWLLGMVGLVCVSTFSWLIALEVSKQCLLELRSETMQHIWGGRSDGRKSVWSTGDWSRVRPPVLCSRAGDETAEFGPGGTQGEEKSEGSLPDFLVGIAC